MAEIEQAVREALLGKPCWHVSAGGVGTTFKLSIGKKIRRIRPLTPLPTPEESHAVKKKPSLPLQSARHREEFRLFNGEQRLLVWCTWRLDGASEPIASSDDTKEEVVLALQGLIDTTVTHVRIEQPAWDLTIQFSNGMILKVFCDHVGADASFPCNWELNEAKSRLAAGPGGQLEIRPRSDDGEDAASDCSALQQSLTTRRPPLH